MFYKKTIDKIYEILNDLSFQINLIKSVQENTTKENRSIQKWNDSTLDSILKTVSNTDNINTVRFREMSEQINNVRKITQDVNDNIIYISDLMFNESAINDDTDRKEIIALLNNVLKTNDSLLSALGMIVNSKIFNSDVITNYLVKKEEEIQTLTASLQVLANGLYNQEYVEFFGIKTYRDWKYICVNGEPITDFDNIKSLTIQWDCEEDRIKVTKVEKQQQVTTESDVIS